MPGLRPNPAPAWTSPTTVDTSRWTSILEVRMGNQKSTAEFQEEAVRRVRDRGYSVKEVSANLGVSTHNLYKWLKNVRPRDLPPEFRTTQRVTDCLFATAWRADEKEPI